MINNLFKFYRIPFIISASLAVVLLSQIYRGGTLELILIVLGAISGMFFLDLDYFIHAYILEPEDNFSKMFRDYIKQKDLVGAFNYIIFHSDEVENKTLNSAIFQAALMVFNLFIVRADVSVYFKVLLLTTHLNSIYRFFYFYFQGHGKDWFWILKKEPSVYGIYAFNFAVLLSISLAIYLFV